MEDKPEPTPDPILVLKAEVYDLLVQQQTLNALLEQKNRQIAELSG